MKALCIRHRPRVGDLHKELHIRDLPLPEPNEKQLRIIVDAVGAGVEGFAEGDIVCGMRAPNLPGPWAEYCLAAPKYVHKLAPNWSFEEGAALPLAGAVVASIVSTIGALDGKVCLVIGASGGLGTILLPALRAAGARSWAVCSGNNRALVERVLDYTMASFGTQLADEGRCVDVTVDLLGGRDAQREGMAVTRVDGCFVTVVRPRASVREAIAYVAGHRARGRVVIKL